MTTFLQTSGFSYYAFHQEPHLKVITSSDELQEVHNVLSASSVYAWDTETTGLAWWKGDRICGAAFATRPNPDEEILSYYLPYRHVTGQTQLSPDAAVKFQKTFLEDPSKTTLAHNIKFDEHMAHQDKMLLKGPRIDTMIEARLYHEDKPMGLKERLLLDVGDATAKAHANLLDEDLKRIAKSMSLGKKEYVNRFGYSGLDIWLCGKYACHDVRATWLLHEFYEKMGVREYYSRSPRGEQYMGIYDTEMLLTEVLCSVERIGIPLDTERVHWLYSHCMKEKAKAEGEFFQKTDLEYFNLGSDDQLRERLLGHYKLPLTKTTKSGALAVDSDVIGSFAKAHPELLHILRFKEMDKKLTTYTLNLLEFCDENGVCHGNFKQMGTNTGRMSATDPNLQNQSSDDSDRKEENDGKDPESVKALFAVQRPTEDQFWKFVIKHLAKKDLTPSKSYRLLLDYSQVELRVLAHYTQDPRLVQTYLDGGDIHDEVEYAVFGTGKRTPEGPKNRRKAKIINFGLSYCMSSIGFARKIPEVTEQEAQEYFDEYNRKFPKVEEFRHRFWNYIRYHDCQFQNMFGRTRHLPDIVSPIRYERQRAERQAIATLIQGTAAEFMKNAMVRIHQWLKAEDLVSRQTCTVHDETQIDGPAEEFAYVARGAKKIMEDFPDFSVPVVVDAEWTITNWADKQELDGL